MQFTHVPSARASVRLLSVRGALLRCCHSTQGKREAWYRLQRHLQSHGRRWPTASRWARMARRPVMRCRPVGRSWPCELFPDLAGVVSDSREGTEQQRFGRAVSKTGELKQSPSFDHVQQLSGPQSRHIRTSAWHEDGHIIARTFVTFSHRRCQRPGRFLLPTLRRPVGDASQCRSVTPTQQGGSASISK